MLLQSIPILSMFLCPFIMSPSQKNMLFFCVHLLIAYNVFVPRCLFCAAQEEAQQSQLIFFLSPFIFTPQGWRLSSRLGVFAKVNVVTLISKTLLCLIPRSRVAERPLEESKAEDNPYDYRRLLRKTSQRRRLIQPFQLLLLFLLPFGFYQHNFFNHFIPCVSFFFFNLQCFKFTCVFV